MLVVLVAVTVRAVLYRSTLAAFISERVEVASPLNAWKRGEARRARAGAPLPGAAERAEARGGGGEGAGERRLPGAGERQGPGGRLQASGRGPAAGSGTAARPSPRGPAPALPGPRELYPGEERGRGSREGTGVARARGAAGGGCVQLGRSHWCKPIVPQMSGRWKSDKIWARMRGFGSPEPLSGRFKVHKRCLAAWYSGSCRPVRRFPCLVCGPACLYQRNSNSPLKTEIQLSRGFSVAFASMASEPIRSLNLF